MPKKNQVADNQQALLQPQPILLKCPDNCDKDDIVINESEKVSCEVPRHFIDPAELDVMRVPVMGTDTNSYEASTAINTLALRNRLPLFNKTVTNRTLIFNKTLHDEMKNYFQRMYVAEEQNLKANNRLNALLKLKQLATPLSLSSEEIKSAKSLAIEKLIRLEGLQILESKFVAPTHNNINYIVNQDEKYSCAIPQKFINTKNTIKRVPVIATDTNSYDAFEAIDSLAHSHLPNSDTQITNKTLIFDKTLNDEMKIHFKKIINNDVALQDNEHKASLEKLKKISQPLTYQHEDITEALNLAKTNGVQLEGLMVLYNANKEEEEKHTYRIVRNNNYAYPELSAGDFYSFNRMSYEVNYIWIALVSELTFFLIHGLSSDSFKSSLWYSTNKYLLDALLTFLTRHLGSPSGTSNEIKFQTLSLFLHAVISSTISTAIQNASPDNKALFYCTPFFITPPIMVLENWLFMGVGAIFNHFGLSFRNLFLESPEERNNISLRLYRFTEWTGTIPYATALAIQQFTSYINHVVRATLDESVKSSVIYPNIKYIIASPLALAYSVFLIAPISRKERFFIFASIMLMEYLTNVILNNDDSDNSLYYATSFITIPGFLGLTYLIATMLEKPFNYVVSKISQRCNRYSFWDSNNDPVQIEENPVEEVHIDVDISNLLP